MGRFYYVNSWGRHCKRQRNQILLILLFFTSIPHNAFQEHGIQCEHVLFMHLFPPLQECRIKREKCCVVTPTLPLEFDQSVEMWDASQKPAPRMSHNAKKKKQKYLMCKDILYSPKHFHMLFYWYFTINLKGSIFSLYI